MSDLLVIAGRGFRSRLIVGTGKYRGLQEMARAHEVSGADGVLMNTAIAEAQDAVLMAEAMRDAVEAARKAFLAGRIPKKLYASASSPMSGVVR